MATLLKSYTVATVMDVADDVNKSHIIAHNSCGKSVSRFVQQCHFLTTLAASVAAGNISFMVTLVKPRISLRYRTDLNPMKKIKK